MLFTYPASISPDGWLLKRLRNRKFAAAYVQAAMDDGNREGLLLALQRVLAARGHVGKVKASDLRLNATTAILAKAGLRSRVMPA